MPKRTFGFVAGKHPQGKHRNWNIEAMFGVTLRKQHERILLEFFMVLKWCFGFYFSHSANHLHECAIVSMSNHSEHLLPSGTLINLAYALDIVIPLLHNAIRNVLHSYLRL